MSFMTLMIKRIKSTLMDKKEKMDHFSSNSTKGRKVSFMKNFLPLNLMKKLYQWYYHWCNLSDRINILLRGIYLQNLLLDNISLHDGGEDNGL